LFNPKTLLNYNNKTYTKDITTAHNYFDINNTHYLVPKFDSQHNKVTLSTKVSPFKLLNPFLSKSLPNWFFTQRFKKLLPTNSLFLHNIHYSDYYNAFKTVFLSNSLTDKHINSVYSLPVKPLHLSNNFPKSYKHRMKPFYLVYSKFLDNQDRINNFSKKFTDMKISSLTKNPVLNTTSKGLNYSVTTNYTQTRYLLSSNFLYTYITQNVLNPDLLSELGFSKYKLKSKSSISASYYYFTPKSFFKKLQFKSKLRLALHKTNTLASKKRLLEKLVSRISKKKTVLVSFRR